MPQKPKIHRIALGETLKGKPVKRKLIARGSEIDGAFIRTRGAHGENLELVCSSETDAKKRFFGLKIAHLLFPKNFPNPAGFNGKILYTRYFPPNKELKKYQATRNDNDWQKVAEKHYENNEVIERFRQKCHNFGLYVDLAPTNVAFLKDRIVAYEIDAIMPEILKKTLEKTPIPESRKKVILKLAEQYQKERE